jgi:hypothetical protein
MRTSIISVTGIFGQFTTVNLSSSDETWTHLNEHVNIHNKRYEAKEGGRERGSVVG